MNAGMSREIGWELTKIINTLRMFLLHLESAFANRAGTAAGIVTVPTG